MKLAAVNPIIDSNLDSILATEVSILVSLLLKKKEGNLFSWLWLEG
jgi:alanine-alpha-ketoisovalerate/valine-pyruvate aminotransferase